MSIFHFLVKHVQSKVINDCKPMRFKYLIGSFLFLPMMAFADKPPAPLACAYTAPHYTVWQIDTSVGNPGANVQCSIGSQFPSTDQAGALCFQSTSVIGADGSVLSGVSWQGYRADESVSEGDTDNSYVLYSGQDQVGGTYPDGNGRSRRVFLHGVCLGTFLTAPQQPTVMQSDSGKAKTPICNACDPVNPSSGSEFLDEKDADPASPLGTLSFHRYYNSAMSIPGDIGAGWSHDYSRHLSFLYAYAPPSQIPPTVAGGAATSSLYDLPADACTQGWQEIKNKTGNLKSGHVSYDYGQCELTLSDGNVIQLALSNNQGSFSPPPNTTNLYAYRDDGHILTFNANSTHDGFTASQGVVEKIVPTIANGVVTAYTLTDDQDGIEQYDANGVLQSITDRAGNVQTLNYNTANKLASVSDAFGHTLSFTYDNSGSMVSFTNAKGEVTQYGYDSNQNLTTVTHPDATIRTYTYTDSNDANGLTSVIDENNNTEFTITYDVHGRVKTSQLPGVTSKMQFSYMYDGSPVQTDPLGAHRTFYNVTIGGHALSQIVDGDPCFACGFSMTTLYSGGWPSSKVDFDNHTTNYTFDTTRGLELSRTEGLYSNVTRTITTSWLSNYRLPSEVDEPGRQTNYTYGSIGNLLTKTVLDTNDNTSRTWTFGGYDVYGRATTIDGARTDVSDITTLAYYPVVTGDPKSGQLHSMTDALGHVATINNYDANGRPLSMTDVNGLITNLSYNSRGWLISKTAGTEITSYTYDASGQLTRMTLPSGAYLNYSYDPAHRMTDIADAFGNNVHFTLDAVGHHIKEEVFDPSGSLAQTRSMTYDSLSNLTSVVGALAIETTTYSYDSNGLVTGITDPNGNQIGKQYDNLNRVKQITNPDNSNTKIYRNALDQITQVTDPRNNQTHYNINALDNASSLVSPDSGTTNYVYDAAGNVIAQTDAKGQVTHYQYDALNRLISTTRADGATVTYGYDDTTNGNHGVGHLTSITDTSGSTTWTYDIHGRPLTKVQNSGSQTLTTSWVYDGVGQLISTTNPSGMVIGYSWLNGRISGMTLNGNALVSNITYQPFGDIKSWSFANGEALTRIYDLDGRLTSYPVGIIGYDNASNIISIANSNLSVEGTSKTYAYDNFNRLTTAAIDGTSTPITYGYDSSNNRVASSGGSASIAYSIAGGSNQISSISLGSNSFTPAYDANGSIVQDITNSYTFDVTGRLASAGGASYLYNGQGQRVQKNGATATTLFNYDGAGHLTGEYDAVSGAGSAIEETVWLNNMPVAVLKSGNVYYIHSDQLNTPRQIDDSSGVPVWAWDTVSYGNTHPDEDPLNSGTQFHYNLRMPGQYLDTESGIFQNWHRDYDPKTGRYLESDPVGLFGGVNTYGYVMGSPLGLSDPYGLFLWPWESSVTILGGTEAQRSEIIADSQAIFNTQRGQELLNIVNGPWYMHGNPQTVYLVDNNVAAGENNWVVIDPNIKTCVVTVNGKIPAKLIRVLAHELGHSITGAKDDGENRMNNVNQNENPIMQELNEPLRTQYEVPK